MRSTLAFVTLCSGVAAFVACYSDPASGTNPTADASVERDATGSGGQDSSVGQDSGSGMDASTKDGSATGDAGTDAGADAEGDAGGTSLNLNGCTAAVYKDETANATPTITWGFGTVPAAGSCITVKKGTAVTWDTAAVDGLVGHPLDAKDGTTPTPIVLANTGTSVTYTFNDEGLFGYVCVNHAFMTGAINVVP